MNNEEKILEMLTGMQQQMDGMQQQMDGMQQQMDRMETRIDSIDTRLTKVEDDVLGVRTLVDVQVDRQLKQLAEGQAAILNQLSEKTPIQRTEKLEEKHEVLSYVVKNLAGEVERLKAAQ